MPVTDVKAVGTLGFEKDIWGKIQRKPGQHVDRQLTGIDVTAKLTIGGQTYELYYDGGYFEKGTEGRKAEPNGNHRLSVVDAKGEEVINVAGKWDKQTFAGVTVEPQQHVFNVLAKEVFRLRGMEGYPAPISFHQLKQG